MVMTPIFILSSAENKQIQIAETSRNSIVIEELRDDVEAP